MRFSLHWSEAKIAAVRDLTPSIRLFEIAPAAGLAEPWRPGAHINVGVIAGGRPDTRSYSLVGRPEADLYRIAVRRDPNGRGGSAYMHGLKPGQALRISNPQSLFEIDWQAPEALLIAGGIGITPILGMAEAIGEHGTPMRLAYCGKRRADMAFVAELEERLGDRLSLHVSEEGSRIDLAAAIAGLGPEAVCYVCGPMRMLDAVRAAWGQAGRSATRLFFETFGSSGHFAAEPFEVLVPRHDVKVTVGAGEIAAAGAPRCRGRGAVRLRARRMRPVRARRDRGRRGDRPSRCLLQRGAEGAWRPAVRLRVARHRRQAGPRYRLPFRHRLSGRAALFRRDCERFHRFGWQSRFATVAPGS